jgi:23S rRNA (guanosine2251-2'-O)-methyltransferase
MQLLLTDTATLESNNDLPLDVFDRFGKVAKFDNITRDELLTAAADKDIILCNKTVIDREIMNAAPNLRYIGLFATGYNNIDIAAAKEKGEKPLIIVCDGVEDPHNLGAIIRSAECAGAHGLVISKHRSAAIGQTVQKSSAGAVTFLPIAKVNNIASAIDELKELGIWTFAADMDGESYLATDFNCPCAIVLGSEGSGVSRLVRDKCDFTVSIPMRGRINSLNVSAAAAVLVFKAAECR